MIFRDKSKGKGNLRGEKNAGRKRCSERKGDNDVREFWDTNDLAVRGKGEV